MTDTSDIVAVGLDLKPETLIRAYENGVFPWPHSVTGNEPTGDDPLLWFCPKRRAIVEFSEFHIPKRLIQYLKKTNWHYTRNEAFEKVIQACSERKDEGTWITKEMKSAYTELHRLGYAHSFEVWESDPNSPDGRALVGGLYGVLVRGVFAGESMFHKKSNASKAALIFTIDSLAKDGLTWIDIQVMTPHMEAMGAKLISRGKFLNKLQESQTEV